MPFELLGILNDSVLIFQKSYPKIIRLLITTEHTSTGSHTFIRKPSVPNSAPLIVLFLVSCGVHGDLGQEKVIPHGFSAACTWAVHRSKNLRIENSNLIGT